jgi:hypothetical protein
MDVRIAELILEMKSAKPFVSRNRAPVHISGSKYLRVLQLRHFGGVVDLNIEGATPMYGAALFARCAESYCEQVA